MSNKVYGNNLVFFDGRLFSGPDVRSCAASTLMILVPSIVWQIEVGAFLAARSSVIIPILVAIIQIMSLFLLQVTAFSDPGIVPRQKAYQEQYDARTKSYRHRQPPRHYDLFLRGHPFKLKYCITCNIYRPPRCTHCSVCENCVERFDHHCPWIGNCIGKRNYWLFFSFVSATGLLNAIVLATSLVQLLLLCFEIKEKHVLGGGDAFVKAIAKAPMAAALTIYGTALVWFTVGLCMYHSYLICTNQTTYEQIKGAYHAGDNPFHRGIIGNFRDILFSRVRPRYFDANTGRVLWPTADDAREVKLTESTSAPIAALGSMQANGNQTMH